MTQTNKHLATAEKPTRCTASSVLFLSAGGGVYLGGTMAWIILILMVMASPAQAERISDDKAILCVIGEAEGEGYNGMRAVSHAIRNRGSFKGVYGCHAPRVQSKAYSREIFNLAQRAWKDSANGSDTTRGATHWEGTSFKTPYWAKDMIVTATIGRQRFYKEKK
jgi:hypothetical protein